MKNENRKPRLFKAGFAVLLIGMLLGSPLLFQGCGIFNKQVMLYPIEQSDIVLLKAGDNFSAPKQGIFLSDFYVQEVMEAKVKQ